MVTIEMVVDCEECQTTLAVAMGAGMRGREVTCRCGSVYRDDRPTQEGPLLPPGRPPAPSREPRRTTTRRVYLAPTDDPATPNGTPIDRAAHAAQVSQPEDPDVVLVRRLLMALRPDCPDPMYPPPPEAPPPVQGPRIRDPQAAWGGIPQGLLPGGRESELRATASDVFARLRHLPDDARAVLAWLRDHATLDEGPRGLFVDVGMAFASEAQAELWSRDFGAKRAGAAPYGRRLVIAADRAWWKAETQAA